jgi:AcrR family transcriptional regulator
MKTFAFDETKLQFNKEFLYLTQEQLPRKVAAICQSVIALYNEGHNFYKMTISDIAKAANIGKGTIYEYFNNKEEIIITAMLLELKNQLQDICETILIKETFDAKYESAFSWIEERVKKNMLMRQMMLTRYSEKSDEVVCELITRMMNQTRANEVLLSIIDAGIKEGLFHKPKNILQEKAAYSTIVYGVIAMLKPEEFGNQSSQEIKDYCRNLFVLILQ